MGGAGSQFLGKRVGESGEEVTGRNLLMGPSTSGLARRQITSVGVGAQRSDGSSGQQENVMTERDFYGGLLPEGWVAAGRRRKAAE